MGTVGDRRETAEQDSWAELPRKWGALLSYRYIGREFSSMSRFDDDASEVIVDSPDLPPIWQVLGANRREDGQWQLGPLSEASASPDAALHVGPQHLVLETAALDCAASRAGTDQLSVLSTRTMHLASGTTGPFRVEATPINAADGRVAVTLAIHDEGNGDRAITAATYVLSTV
jgi:hypothetical protein